MASLRFHPISPPTLQYPKRNFLLSKTNAKPLRQWSRMTAPNCTKQDQAAPPTSRHFVLVHGQGHGGWIWYKLVSMLNSAGHHATALDLPGGGIHPKNIEEVNTIEEYSEPLMEVMEAVPSDERVVLVGHSYGGIPVSLAMERFPHKIAAAVFLSASMSSSTNPMRAIIKKFVKGGLTGYRKGTMASKTVYGKQGLKSIDFEPEDLVELYYHHCPPEDVTLATMLVRPGKLFYGSLLKDEFLTAENHGSVSRVYVVCKDDRSISPETQIWLAEMSPETEKIEMEGSDHMLMISMPRELFTHLVDISDRYQ